MADDSNWHPTASDLAWLRVVLHTFVDVRGGAPTQEQIAEAGAISTDGINRFLDPDGVGRDGLSKPQSRSRSESEAVSKSESENEKKLQRPDTVRGHARKIRTGLRKLIENGDLKITPDLEKIRPALRALFPDIATLGASSVPEVSERPRNARVVLDEVVWSTHLPRSPGLESQVRETMLLLQGFWFLLRPASPDDDQDSADLELSVSLLRIIPQEVEMTKRYPVFKMRQAGNRRKEKGQSFSFSGVLAPSADEAVFAGRWSSKDKFFAMVAEYDPTDLYSFRGEHLSFMHGVMLGITSAIENVGAPFAGFFIPYTEKIPYDICDEDFKKIESKYTQEVDTVSANEALARLRSVGIKISDEDWKRVIRQFRAKRTFVV